MDALIVWTDPSFIDQGCTADFALDLAFGIGNDPENEFSVILPDNIMLEPNSLLYIDGTDYGGVVYERKSDTAEYGIFEWHGRTWHGVLADRVLVPRDATHVVAKGSVKNCISELIEKLDLADMFVLGECPDKNVDFTYRRYQTGFRALFNMLSSVDLKPTFVITHLNGGVRVAIGADAIIYDQQLADGELANVEIDDLFTPYNHIVGLGSGQLDERLVYECFANSDGEISEEQSIFGIAHRAKTYESNTDSLSDLKRDARDALAEFQQKSGASVNILDNIELTVGDYLVATDKRLDKAMLTRVEKVVIKVSDGIVDKKLLADG